MCQQHESEVNTGFNREQVVSSFISQKKNKLKDFAEKSCIELERKACEELAAPLDFLLQTKKETLYLLHGH